MAGKLKKYIMLFLSIVILTSCTMSGPDSGDLAAPQPGELNLWKYWKYDNAYSLNTREKLMADEYYRNLTAVIDRNSVIIGTDRIKNPVFRAIRVRTYDYFLSTFRAVPEDAGLESEYTDVYSITDEKGYSSRLFKISEDKIAVERNNILIFFKKAEEPRGGTEEAVTDTEEDSQETGVLIGLKGERVADGTVPGPLPLRTLWIRYRADGSITVYEVENILLPKDTFYRLKIIRDENIDTLVETITLENLSSGSTVKEDVPKKLISRFSDFTFISDGYISTVTRLSKTKGFGLFQYFATRSTDRIGKSDGSGIGDLFGPEGSETYRAKAAEAVVGSDHAEEYLKSVNEKSFILTRQNGAWAYRGRINFPQEFSDLFIDFSMTLRDNSGVFRYDILTPQWSRIKVLVPEAQDAVSSPEANITIVKTDNALEVYSRDEEGNLSQEPKAVIPLKGAETIIMHEWSGGNYVDEWENTVKKIGKEIKN